MSAVHDQINQALDRLVTDINTLKDAIAALQAAVSAAQTPEDFSDVATKVSDLVQLAESINTTVPA